MGRYLDAFGVRREISIQRGGKERIAKHHDKQGSDPRVPGTDTATSRFNTMGEKLVCKRLEISLKGRHPHTKKALTTAKHAAPIPGVLTPPPKALSGKTHQRLVWGGADP